MSSLLSVVSVRFAAADVLFVDDDDSVSSSSWIVLSGFSSSFLGVFGIIRFLYTLLLLIISIYFLGLLKLAFLNLT